VSGLRISTQTPTRIGTTVLRVALRAALLVAVALPALAAAGADPGEDAGHGRFLFYEILNFALLIGVLVYFARKPALEFFAGRHAQIKGDIESAAQLLEEAERRNSELQRRVAELDSDLDDIRATARQRAEEERERILAEAHEAAERIQRDAVASVDQELRRAQTALREEAALLATELAAQILDQQVGDSDRERLMDEFISSVEGANGSAGGSQ
jgi:F-type H+-transporting ATPase subunit b